MSHMHQAQSPLPTGQGIDYSPLPLTHEDHPHGPYNPDPRDSPFNVPTGDPDGMPYTDDMGIPMGAAQPRFLGRALYDDGGAGMRHSVASSEAAPSIGRASSFGADSVYNLNSAAAAAYRDDPGFFVGEQPMRRGAGEKRAAAYTNPTSRRKKPIIIGIAAAVLLIAGIGVALALTLGKHKSTDAAKDSSTSSGDAASNPTASGSPTGKIAIVSGTDGSTVTASDGSTFQYSNPFGGTWYWDPTDPYNNAARPQTWSPALNETFNYGVDKIRGVNLGGWLVTEPFIVPALYQTLQSRPTTTGTIIDEWTLVEAMQADTANGGISQLEDHYKTFITEQDFVQIAAAGLNFVRIPLGYWAIEVLDGESFLPKTSWTYFLKAVEWARKYGLRINLDLHALPGSQNGWNHSGRLGTYNVMYGPMGIANAERSLNYIRILAEFISQPEYRDVIAMFGVTNEPQGNQIGLPNLQTYYYAAYNAVRTASGTGAGNGPMVSFHDGFIGLDQWAGYLPNADRASLDSHPYLCFQGQSTNPINSYLTTPCDQWGGSFNSTMAGFGFIVAGEFSNAVTDCGLYVNGVGQGVRYEGTYTTGGPWPTLGNCTTDWLDYQNWDAPTKKAYITFAKASMDALQNWFFWTWKVGNSTAGVVEAPHWSYQLGLQNDWMPTDPRTAVGQCNNANPFTGTLSSWQTGGAGAGSIAPSVQAEFAWPPASISFAGGGASPASLLPSYTQTGPLMTLPTATLTAAASATAKGGSGWFNSADSTGFWEPVATCSYLDPWIGSSVAPPSPLCTGGVGVGVRRGMKQRLNEERVVEARVTAVPTRRR